MTKSKAYSYIRFSTPEQRKGDSLLRQLQASKEWAEKNGYVLDTKLNLRDLGLSAYHGDHLERGALGQFLKLVETGKICPGSVLIVESFDRLSREKVLDALSLFTRIIQAEIKLVTTMDNKEYTVQSVNENPTDLMVSILVMMRAHEESATKAKRGAAAWSKKREKAINGERKLTARTHGWLKLSKDRKSYEVIPEHADVVRRMFRERLKGKSPQRIAQEFNLDKDIPWRPVSPRHGKGVCGWWPGYIDLTLKNRAVLGEFQPHKMIGNMRVPEGSPLKNYFPAVVTEELFYDVQKTFNLAQVPTKNGGTVGRGGRNGSVHNLFSFIAVCAYCGESMQFMEKTARVSKEQRRYMICSRALRKAGCEHRSIFYNDLESFVLRYCRTLNPTDLLPGREQVETQIWNLSAQKLAAESKLERTNEEIQKLRKSFRVVENDTIRKMVEEDLQTVLQEKEELETNVGRLQREIDTVASASQDVGAHLEALQQLHEAMAQLQGQERVDLRLRLRNEIRRLISKIVVYPGNNQTFSLRIEFFTGNVQHIRPNAPEGAEFNETKKQDGFILYLDEGGKVVDVRPDRTRSVRAAK